MAMSDGVGIGREEARALLSWWREAGVDTAVRDDAPSWRSLRPPSPPRRTDPDLRTPSVETPPREAPPAPPPADCQAPLPDTLEAIERWLGERSASSQAQHVVGEIVEGAALQILVARADGEDGLDADAGVLLGAMLRAMGFEAAPLAFIDPAFLAGRSRREPLAPELIDAVRKRLRLAGPERLLLFGDQAARALLDTPLAKARGSLHHVETVPTVATFQPRWLLERPADKRLAWRDLQILMGSE